MSRPQDAPPPRNVLMTALMILVGIILLLPGLCSFILIVMLVPDDPVGTFRQPDLVLVWIACFAVAAGGVLLIRRAVKGPRPN